MAKKTKGGPALVVQSKVKEVIKKNKMNCASDVMGALTTVVTHKITAAVARAKSNGRKTVRANDF
jgi:histone H3/H4